MFIHMRVVLNDSTDTKTLLLKNRYNKALCEYEIRANEEIDLPTYNKNQRLIDVDNGRELFIYEGYSGINLSNCYVKYDFKGLKAHEIDYFLQNNKFKPKTSIKKKQAIKDFVALLNINYDDYIIMPPFYEELEQELCLA